jgi:nucleotide-binding universal stress UspA family protein
MFKHILLPTDGSKLADRAITQGVKLAKSLGAKVTLFSVAPEFLLIADDVFAVPTSVDIKRRYDRDVRLRAEKMLAAIERRVARAGLKVASVVVVSDLPYREIIKVARKRKCDLVVMASHGRRGLSGLLLGSETVKVLTHSRIPVLVVR